MRSMRAVLAVFAMIAVTAVGVGSSSAEPSANPENLPQKQEDNCVLGVGQPASTMECFSTLDAAWQSVGVDVLKDVPGELEDSVPMVEQALRSSLILATHFDFVNLTGPSLTITGSVLCGGGTTNLSGGSWNDRMDSTLNGCGGKRIYHYEFSTCGGAVRSSTINILDLGVLKNEVSCVRYG